MIKYVGLKLSEFPSSTRQKYKQQRSVKCLGCNFYRDTNVQNAFIYRRVRLASTVLVNVIPSHFITIAVTWYAGSTAIANLNVC